MLHEYWYNPFNGIRGMKIHIKWCDRCAKRTKHRVVKLRYYVGTKLEESTKLDCMRCISRNVSLQTIANDYGMDWQSIQSIEAVD